MHTFVLSKMVHAKTAEIIQMESLRDYLDSEPQLYEGAIKLSCFPINVQDNRDDTAWAYAYQLKVDVLMLFHVINTTDEHYILLKEILENLLHRYGFSVDDFCVTRVDFCENVVVRNAKERELLFRLLQSCPTHAAYTVRESIYDSSVYSKSKSRTFNIYDKEKERRDKMRIRHNPNLYPQDYEQNVIRFEHQIRKDHIKYKRRNGVPSKYDYWINAETEQAYLAQIQKMIPTGDFLAKSAIKNYIEADTALSNKKKSNLLAFCDIVAAGGLDAAKKQWCYNTYNSYLSYFTNKSISPIPIPDDWNIGHIRNPFVL